MSLFDKNVQKRVKAQVAAIVRAAEGAARSNKKAVQNGDLIPLEGSQPWPGDDGFREANKQLYKWKLTLIRIEGKYYIQGFKGQVR